MKVEQIANNQFVVNEDDGYTFQSYETVIAEYLINERKVILSEHWNCSRTTSKYLYQFMREYAGWEVFRKQDVERMIAEGTAVVV